jgi:hypothetical protein
MWKVFHPTFLRTDTQTLCVCVFSFKQDKSCFKTRFYSDNKHSFVSRFCFRSSSMIRNKNLSTSKLMFKLWHFSKFSRHNNECSLSAYFFLTVTTLWTRYLANKHRSFLWDLTFSRRWSVLQPWRLWSVAVSLITIKQILLFTDDSTAVGRTTRKLQSTTVHSISN